MALKINPPLIGQIVRGFVAECILSATLQKPLKTKDFEQSLNCL